MKLTAWKVSLDQSTNLIWMGKVSLDQATNLIFSEDLGRHPEAAGGLEGCDQLVLALRQDVLPALHQGHGDIEGSQDGRGDQEP